MGPNLSLWNRFDGRRLAVDLVVICALGLLTYLFLGHPGSLEPLEGAILIMALAALLILGRRGLSWQQGLIQNAFLPDLATRILSGSREIADSPATLGSEGALVSGAINALILDVNRARGDLDALQGAVTRDWQEVDKVLATAQQQMGIEHEARNQAAERLTRLGTELRSAFENTLQLDQIELNQRLRADQHRFQAQAFVSSLDQVKLGLDQFENLLEELRDTFPRLLREGDALGRLANSGMRQGARLGLAVKALASHSPRLLEEARSRADELRRFRITADALRDQVESLSRRLEGFRADAVDRTRTFGGAQSSLKVIDQAAQQAGLLAVNAAILAKQGGGAAGVQAIGGRLKHLAGQTALGAAEIGRELEQHRRELDRETAGLWDLHEVSEQLLSGVQELLRVAGNIDHQGQDMERALETHMGHVEQVRQVSDRSELALHEVGERAGAMEAVLGRLWTVEAKLVPELERLSRSSERLGGSGTELVRISQLHIEEIWDILARHQEIRRTEGYRQVVSGDVDKVLRPSPMAEQSRLRVAWTRSHRYLRRLGTSGDSAPLGTRDEHDGVRMLLLGWDPLGLPDPSALVRSTWSDSGKVWSFDLREELRQENHRMTLLDILRTSDLAQCLPGLQVRVTTEGITMNLPWAFADLPMFIAGLGLELTLGPGEWEGPLRQPRIPDPIIQVFLWGSPALDPIQRESVFRMVHSWIRDEPSHDFLLPMARYEGHRPPCAWLVADLDAQVEVADPFPVRELVLKGEPGCLHAWRDKLFAAGAVAGSGGLTLGAIRLNHAHPEALLLQLFRQDADLAGAFHPDLVPFQERFRREVLAAESPEPYRAAWSLLEDLQRQGWILPLPS